MQKVQRLHKILAAALFTIPAFIATLAIIVSSGKGAVAIQEGQAPDKLQTYVMSITPISVEPNITPSTETDKPSEAVCFSESESYMLMKIAMSEAEGESTEGKALVMLVVLNRVLNPSFPDSIQEVIFQKNQFTPVLNGRYDRCEPDEDCYKALELITGGWNESDGALYFESCSNSDNWHSRNLDFLFRKGNHNFYR